MTSETTLRTVLVRKVISDQTGPLDSVGQQRLQATPVLCWPVDEFLLDVNRQGIELATDNFKEAISNHFRLPQGEKPRLSLSRGTARPICLHVHGTLRQLSEEDTLTVHFTDSEVLRWMRQRLTPCVGTAHWFDTEQDRGWIENAETWAVFGTDVAMFCTEAEKLQDGETVVFTVVLAPTYGIPPGGVVPQAINVTRHV